MLEQNDLDWNELLKDRIHKKDIEFYVNRLHNDEGSISLLVGTLLSSQDERITVNAAWIMSHLSKSDKELYLVPYYDKIADLAMSPHLSIRRALVLSILFDMSRENQFRTDLLDYCLTGMLDRKENHSTRAIMIKLAAKMCKPYPELINELIINLDVLYNEMTPSIACARKNALIYLKKHIKEI